MAEKLPIPGYHFNVGFIFKASDKKKPIDIGFKEISGVAAELLLEDKGQLGINGYTIMLPKQTKFNNLVLKKGLTEDASNILNWFEKSRVSMVVKTATVILTIFNEKTHKALINYMFYNVFPIKWEISGFDAMASQFIIESVELKYDYFERLY